MREARITRRRSADVAAGRTRRTTGNADAKLDRSYRLAAGGNHGLWQGLPATPPERLVRCLSYSYSGIRLEPKPWTPILLDLKARVEALTEQPFNSVLLNYYRDQNDSMGMHSDDERELGRRPAIASLSLGEERTFILKHKTRKDLKTARLKLPPGSLLLMSGNTQRCWQHSIPKRAHADARINLTFRNIKGRATNA